MPIVATMTRLVDRPVRDLRGREHVADQDQRGEEIEEPVREDRADERRARAPAVRQPPPQHRDASELADPPGQRGVREQADRERREDVR